MNWGPNEYEEVMMQQFEVEKGKRVRVVKPAPRSCVGREGEITTHFRSTILFLIIMENLT